MLARFSQLVTRVGQYNRRKIANSTVWSQHSWANGSDFHVASLEHGDVLYAWLAQNKEALGIRTILWRVTGHYDHVHVDFWPKGRLTPPLTLTGVGSFQYSTGIRQSARIQLIPPEKVWDEQENEMNAAQEAKLDALIEAVEALPKATTTQLLGTNFRDGVPPNEYNRSVGQALSRTEMNVLSLVGGGLATGEDLEAAVDELIATLPAATLNLLAAKLAAGPV